MTDIGRPSKFDPDRAARVLAALAAGNFMETAAAYAGVGRATLYRWLEQGAAEDAPVEFRDFRDAVERARAEAEVRMVAIAGRAAQGGALLSRTTRTLPDGSTEVEEKWAAPDGRVALEFAGRAWPARWRRRTSTELTGPDGGPLEVEHSGTLAVHAERVHSRLAAWRSEQHGLTSVVVLPAIGTPYPVDAEHPPVDFNDH